MNPDQHRGDQTNYSNPNDARNNHDDSNSNPNVQQQQPQNLNAFTMIPPNETRRNNLRMAAQKEEELFQKYREAQRSAPVHMNPERLGGSGTMVDAREQQFMKQRNSKLQKQLKKEEEKKRRKEEEEREIQKFKDKQREKAELQECKRKQEDMKRRELYAEDHSRVNNVFLQQMSVSSAPSRLNEPVSNTNNYSNIKMSPEEQKQEHIRKNTAFLDKIERQMKTVNTSAESSSPPDLLCSGRTAGQNEPNSVSRPDLEWSLMKLMSAFPQFDKDILEDFLIQCNGDYEQASKLLS